jgi:AcrR family transcriptional regulator
MVSRLTRAQQNARNRGLLLAAAREVFLVRGYHAATLEQIAERAGFSKGVVYSRFSSKADLFLALLERRIAERAAENRRVIEGTSGAEGIVLLSRHTAAREQADRDWWLLLIEFRVHAARDPELNARYAMAHARTVQGIAAVIEELYDRAAEAPPAPPQHVAQALVTVAVGSLLEQAADPGAPSMTEALDLLARLSAVPFHTGDGAHSSRRSR